MLVCKQCGDAYYRTSTRTSKRRLYYYRCLGSDDYRYLNGRACDNRPIRQDHLDDVVWQQVIRLLEEPELIQREIERRIQAIRESDPSQRREAALRKEQVRLHKGVSDIWGRRRHECFKIGNNQQMMEAKHVVFTRNIMSIR